MVLGRGHATPHSRCSARSSMSVPMLSVARLLLGLTIGISVVVVPVFVAESARRRRSAARCWCSTRWPPSIGIIIGYLAAWALAGTGSWRWMLGLAAVPARAGHADAAAAARHRPLVHDAGPPRRGPPALLSRSIRMPTSTPNWTRCSRATAAKSAAAAIREMLRKPYLRATIFVVGLGFFIQITGINAIVYYSPRIFEAMGFEGNFALLGAARPGPGRRPGGRVRLAGPGRPARPAADPARRHRHDDRRQRAADRRLHASARTSAAR